MAVGSVWPPEWRWSTDTQTGRPVRQMSATGSNYPRYFYNPSVTPDGRRVVFTADHGGQSNIYFVDWEGDDKADGGPGRA